MASTSSIFSVTINRHFGVNFYEYINQYRISEARACLIATENADKNITEIFYGAGFKIPGMEK